MSFVTKKHLPRRTFLRGAGVTLSLPLLESMVPAFTALAQTAAAPRLRLGFCFMPHGAVMANWTPAAEGALQLSPILAPLERVQGPGRGPQQPRARDGRSAGPGRQRRRSHTVPGGVSERRPSQAHRWRRHPRRRQPSTRLPRPGIGQDTLLPSLELAIEDYSGLVGSCDVGFSCTYMNTISWRTPTAPMPMEINPRVVFDRMFGDGSTAEERRRRIETQRSILDAVTDQVRRLQGGLGTSDRSRVVRLPRYGA